MIKRVNLTSLLWKNFNKKNNMIIETKYSINDTVFFLKENKIWMGYITALSVSVNENIHVRYSVKCIFPNCSEFTELKGDMLFKTKEALIDGLLSDFSKCTTK